MKTQKKVKKIQGKNMITRRKKRMLITIFSLLTLPALCITNVYAAPAGVGGEIDTIVDILVWVARAALGIFAIFNVIQFIKGWQEEDLRTRNSGLVGLAVCVVGIGVIEAVKGMFF